MKLFIFSVSLWLVPWCCWATTTYTPKQYLQLYLDSDETYRQSVIEHKINSAQAEQAADLYQTHLLLTPSTQRLWDSDRSEDKATTTTVNGGITQALPTGTLLSLEATRFLDDPNSSPSAHQYSLSLTQNLLKNSFGRAKRLARTAAQQFEQAAELKSRSQLVKSCAAALDVYAQTYAAQETQKIYSDILAASKKLLQFSQRSFKKRMIRKIDLYSAQADHLRIQRQYIESQKQLTEAKIQFVENTNDLSLKNNFHLLDLKPFYKSFKSLKVDVENNFEYQSISKQSLASEARYKSVKNNNATQVDLSLQAGERQGQFNIDRSQYVDQKFISASLSIDWPFFNKSLRANTAEALFERELALSRQRDFKTRFQQTQQQLTTQSLNLTAQNKLSGEQVQIYKKQTAEARRLLRSGKMEFEDYLRFRDLLLNEQINLINNRRKLWGIKSQIAVLDNNKNFLCKDLSL